MGGEVCEVGGGGRSLQGAEEEMVMLGVSMDMAVLLLAVHLGGSTAARLVIWHGRGNGHGHGVKRGRSLRQTEHTA